MKRLFYNPEQIVTVNTNGKNVKRGAELNELGVLENHSILTENGIISEIFPNYELEEKKFDEKIDLSGKVLMPGLVESHTHTVFAGSRADEFRMKLAGISYEEIAKQGGGILNTVDAVRKSSFDELIEISKSRIEKFIELGVTSLEIKSGYGLSYYDEIKMLQVINELSRLYPIDIIPTFLGAHMFPPEYQNDKNKYVDLIINEMLPFIAENKLAIFIDAFCESTAFSARQVEDIFNKAIDYGLKLKLHTEQFNRIGGLDVALNLNATSVDHLEVLNETEIEKLASSDTAAVLLPGVSFFLDYGFAPARKLIDSDAIVALATDFNPGSSHILNPHLVMSLAALKAGMTIEETISAYTINAAYALNIHERAGSIEIGKQADFSVFSTDTFSDITYSIGQNLNTMTIKKGEVVFNG
jgi:imidazolonepropionase